MAIRLIYEKTDVYVVAYPIGVVVLNMQAVSRALIWEEVNP